MSFSWWQSLILSYLAILSALVGNNEIKDPRIIMLNNIPHKIQNIPTTYQNRYQYITIPRSINLNTIANHYNSTMFLPTNEINNYFNGKMITTIIYKKNMRNMIYERMQSIESTLCNQLRRRHLLQKIEFGSCWAFMFLLALTSSSPNDQSVSSSLHRSALLFIQATLFTRLGAYAVDFANAR